MSQISLKCCLCYIIKAFHPNPIPADLIPLLIPSQNVCNFNLKSCFFIFNMSLIFILSLLNCGFKWASMTCSIPLFHALEKGKAFYVDQSQSEVTQNCNSIQFISCGFSITCYRWLSSHEHVRGACKALGYFLSGN